MPPLARRKEIASAAAPGRRRRRGRTLSLVLLARHTYGQVDTRTDEEISHHCTDSTHTFPPPVHSSNSLHASGTNVGYINGTWFKGRNRNRRRVCSRNEAGYDSMRAQPNPAIPNQSIFWIQKRCALVQWTQDFGGVAPRNVSSCILCAEGYFVK